MIDPTLSSSRPRSAVAGVDDGLGALNKMRSRQHGSTFYIIGNVTVKLFSDAVKVIFSFEKETAKCFLAATFAVRVGLSVPQVAKRM